MSCEIARFLIENNDPSLVEHLRSCPSCAIAAHTIYYEAPPGLEQKIRQSLGREIAGTPYWRWGAIAASLLLAASLATNIEIFQSRVSARQATTDAVLSAHLRSLAGTHLLDVLSSDQHTVKPWFNGKLDFSPRVKTVPGFPLLGGRLEYLSGRPAAALIYGRNKHIINLFMWLDDRIEIPATQTRNGFYIHTWSSGGLTFCVVSDLTEAELGEFVNLYRQDPS